MAAPLKVAVILDYAHFIAPQGDPIYVADLSQTLIQIQDWAANPDVTGSFVATVLITENLLDLNRALVESPYSAKIRINLPTADEIRAFVVDERPRRGGVREGVRGGARGARGQARRPLARLDPLAREAGADQRPEDHRRLPDADEEGVHREGGSRPAGVPRVRAHARRRGGPRRGEGLAARGRGAARSVAARWRSRWATCSPAASAPARPTSSSAWPATSASPASS